MNSNQKHVETPKLANEFGITFHMRKKKIKFRSKTCHIILKQFHANKFNFVSKMVLTILQYFKVVLHSSF